MTKNTGLDLDALEREGDTPEPYTFRVNGRDWTARHPDDVDWTVIAAMDPDDPRDVLAAYLDEATYREFVQQGVPKWKILKLMAALNRHYYGSADAPGESGALPAS